MSIKIRSLPFTESLISAAPDTTGVFALWQNGGVIYLGKASAGSATIRKALGEQFQGRRWNEPVVTRCSWEIAEDADKRHRELLHEFESAHRCLPLWNDPQRLPT
jgi:hypothetical protein